jgi:hypothetical protein
MAFVLVEKAARLPTSLSIAGGSTFASSSKSYSLRPVLFNYLEADRPLLTLHTADSSQLSKYMLLCNYVMHYALQRCDVAVHCKLKA